MKINNTTLSGVVYTTPDGFKDLLMGNWAKKLKRSVKELIGGKNTYMPKKKKSKDTVRTKSVKSGLRSAGLTPEEIKKLQGKK